MTKNRPLIFGAHGQVGSALMQHLKPAAMGATRQQIDLANRRALADYLKQQAPSVIYNAAAYTQVDRAQTHPVDAFAINHEAVAIIAHYCAEHTVPLVHFSTDYVFDGSGTTPWQETHRPSPLNIYGKSKYAGEQAIIASQCPCLILRTSWVYNAQHRNFFTTMLARAKEQSELRIVNDQIGAPTYAPDLAKMAIQAFEKAQTYRDFPSGIYHLCAKGATSWYHFAEALFESFCRYNLTLRSPTLIAVPSSDFPTPATRPLNSRLDCHKIESILDVIRPHWSDSLERCIQSYGNE